MHFFSFSRLSVEPSNINASSPQPSARSPPEGSEDENQPEAKSPSKSKAFGNNIFAVSGIPAFNGQKTPDRNTVIMTQPSRASDLGPKADFGVMSRSFEGDLPGIHGRPSSAGSSARRDVGPQPVDPRRAISPGPELYSSATRISTDPRRAISPAPDLVAGQTSFTSTFSFGKGFSSGTPSLTAGVPRSRNSRGATPVAVPSVPSEQTNKRTDYVRPSQVHVISPTKLQAFEKPS